MGVAAGQRRQAQHLEQTIGSGLRSVVSQPQETDGGQHIAADCAADNCMLSLLGHPPEPGSQDQRGPAVKERRGFRACGGQQDVPGTHYALGGGIDTGQ